MVARVEIEKEIQNGPFEPGPLAHVNGEATATDFDGAVGVDESESLGEDDMIFGIHDGWLISMNADLGIVCGLLAKWHGRLRKIG